MGTKLKLPDKWKEFTNFGDVVPGTNILITKVPLSEDFFHANPDAERFTPATLAQSAMVKFGKRIGLVLDLTFTSRFVSEN